jgi:CDP-diacylglycerol--glycerol-3-phosphate 3-phosphatidyltransferase
MKHKLTMANALSVLRIILSVALLAPPALSPAFLVLYAAAGLTDMLDGFVARSTKTETELGAKLDSIADLTLAVICLARILPTVAAPAWLWAWVTFIAVVKVANVVSGLVMGERLVMPHTVVNKVAGFVAFLVLFAIPTFGVVAPSIPACVVTTFAAVQESHLIRTGHN